MDDLRSSSSTFASFTTILTAPTLVPTVLKRKRNEASAVGAIHPPSHTKGIFANTDRHERHERIDVPPIRSFSIMRIVVGRRITRASPFPPRRRVGSSLERVVASFSAAAPICRPSVSRSDPRYHSTRYSMESLEALRGFFRSSPDELRSLSTIRECEKFNGLAASRPTAKKTR